MKEKNEISKLEMPCKINCPTCDGQGFLREENGEEIICPSCDGDGFLSHQTGLDGGNKDWLD